MRVVKIPKGGGRFRRIYVPDDREKAVLRALAVGIARKAELSDTAGVCHGFVRGRSPVTNARAHVGRAFTVSFDLQDFFDTVTADRLAGTLSPEELDLVLVSGAARQGLPTSPAVANLAATALDRAIIRWRDEAGLAFVYTRYADDLAFSCDGAAVVDALLTAVPGLVAGCGFVVNRAKTHVQSARGGRRVVTGVAVDDALHPTRRAKRRLRAAAHQGHGIRVRGLREWCRLKCPGGFRPEQAESERLVDLAAWTDGAVLPTDW